MVLQTKYSDNAAIDKISAPLRPFHAINTLFTMTAALLCIWMLISCDATIKEKTPAAILGIESIPQVRRCAESIEVFLGLAQKTDRDITLLLLSSNGNLSPMPKKQLLELRDIVKKKRWHDIIARTSTGEPGVLSDENYHYAAARLGLIKEIYWVQPSKLLEYSDAERRVQEMLLSPVFGIDPNEVAAFHYRNGCVSGPYAGVTVNICGVETLPVISGPVILDIDAGFFPLYASERGMYALTGLKDFLEKMAIRKIPITEAYIRRTLREGTLSPLYLHIAGNVEKMLKEPALAHAAPPELWSLTGAAADILSEGTPMDAVKFIKDARKKYPEDPFLLMLSGIAAALSGNITDGEKILTTLCAKERETCYSLTYVARSFRDKGRIQDAERFTTIAARAHPDLPGNSPAR